VLFDAFPNHRIERLFLVSPSFAAILRDLHPDGVRADDGDDRQPTEGER